MAQQIAKRNPYLAEIVRYDNRNTARPRVSRAERQLRRRRRQRMRRMVILAVAAAFGLFLWGMIGLTMRLFAAPQVDGSKKPVSAQEKEEPDILTSEVQGISARVFAAHPDWTENFLTVNEYSRPGDALKEVNNIFVHYTANPGTSAAQNRSYFEQLKDTHERSASAHFIIGYQGEIVQCIPLNEIAYAVQTRNQDSISIECCYLADDGSFTQETYDSLVTLLAWLTQAYGLGSEDILRHYDCGGKKCPVYYVQDETAWEQLKKDVGDSKISILK